jgi:hypothetical protein
VLAASQLADEEAARASAESEVVRLNQELATAKEDAERLRQELDQQVQSALSDFNAANF